MDKNTELKWVFMILSILYLYKLSLQVVFIGTLCRPFTQIQSPAHEISQSA